MTMKGRKSSKKTKWFHRCKRCGIILHSSVSQRKGACLKCERSSSLSHGRNGAPSADGGIMGLKPEQGMMSAALRGGW